MHSVCMCATPNLACLRHGLLPMDDLVRNLAGISEEHEECIPTVLPPMNLEPCKDSVYAQELQRHDRKLHFAFNLESDYVLAHLRRLRRRIQIWFSFHALISLILASNEVRDSGLGSAAALWRVCGVLPCALVLAWLPWTPWYEKAYLRIAPRIIPLFFAAISVFVARAMASGQPEQLAALSVLLIAVHFFTGLLFRQAIVTVPIMLVAFVAAAIALGLRQDVLVTSIAVLLCTATIGAIIHWDGEKSQRTNFLEDALIRQMATRDGLSGLLNRRVFDEHLQRVWALALRESRNIALLMIDIDHFKRYNDTFGHQAGDQVLRRVGKAVAAFARRPMDIAARYGGEEFAVILYDVTLEQAHETGDRICHMVQCLRTSTPRSAFESHFRLSVSIGVACVALEAGRSPQGLIQMADEALYEAKQAGRNRVVAKGASDYDTLSTGSFTTVQGVA
jgi:diguanylate cyclase (GGDEF)-like protein